MFKLNELYARQLRLSVALSLACVVLWLVKLGLMMLYLLEVPQPSNAFAISLLPVFAYLFSGLACLNFLYKFYLAHPKLTRAEG